MAARLLLTCSFLHAFRMWNRTVASLILIAEPTCTSLIPLALSERHSISRDENLRKEWHPASVMPACSDRVPHGNARCGTPVVKGSTRGSPRFPGLPELG